MKRNKSRQSIVPAVAETEDEAQMVAQFLAFYRDVKRIGKAAPYGQFLNRANAAAREKGQEFLRQHGKETGLEKNMLAYLLTD